VAIELQGESTIRIRFVQTCPDGNIGDTAWATEARAHLLVRAGVAEIASFRDDIQNVNATSIVRRKAIRKKRA
jgi:hypothetical protein